MTMECIMESILVVDDEPRIQDVVRRYLERDGYQVLVASNGEEAIESFRHERPSLVVLDLMMPHLDGWQVCREIRRDSRVPIIILTARTEESDKLLGLDLGADDYMMKPFSPRELLARVRAVLRRSGDADATALSAQTMRIGDLVMDLGRHESHWGAVPLPLTPAEFRLLVVLARAHGRVLTRAQLVDLAMGEEFGGYERTVDAHIKNLRRKLHTAGAGGVVATVRGVGYRLGETADADAIG